jgi:hypothetical protein
VSRNFPHLGFDPAPGDVELSRSFARQVSNLAHELGTMQAELTTIDLAGWTGKAAIAFRDHLGQEITPLIRKAYQSFDNAAVSLNRWTSQLQGFQAEADTLEREAAAKQGALDSANHALNASSQSSSLPSSSSAGGSPNPSPSGTDHRNLQKQQKQQAVTDAGNALNSVRHRAHELHDRYITAAGVVARSLDNAGHIAPPEPGLFDDLLNDVAGAWDATCDWVKEHADLIKAISDALSDISAALQLAAILCLPLEPLGGILETLSLVAGGAALLGDLVAKAGGADVSWASIGIAALGVVPGLSTFARGASDVARGANAEERAAQLAEEYKTSSIDGHTEEGTSLIANVGNKSIEEHTGIQFKSVVLFGKKDVQTLTAKGFMGRAAMVSEDSLVGGQDLGSGGAAKLLNGTKMVIENASFRKLVGDGKVLNTLDKVGAKAGEWGGKIDGTSNLARNVDSTIASQQLISSINGHMPEFRKEFGSRFHHMVTAA